MNLKDAVGALKEMVDLAKAALSSIKQWSPKTWALAILAVLLLLVGGAAGDRYWENSQMVEQ